MLLGTPRTHAQGGGIYPTVETVRLDRNVTCNFGPLRQVGWSVDVCDGRFNVSLVRQEVRTLPPFPSFHWHPIIRSLFPKTSYRVYSSAKKRPLAKAQ